MSGDFEREKAEAPKLSHDFNQPNNQEHSAFHNELLPFHGERGHQLSSSQIEDANAQTLTERVNDIRRGTAQASESALLEVREMNAGNYLQGMAQKLQDSGSAKVSYGKDGEVEHLIFNGKDGGAPIDIDVKGDSINGRSAAQIKESSVQQSKEYVAASLADPKVTDSSGKPLSAETQEQANKLMGALLDGNVDNLTKTAQEIMKHPEMARTIESAFDRINVASPVSFGVDDKGHSMMQTNEGLLKSVIVPADGKAYAVSTDAWGKAQFAKSADLQKTMTEVSDQEQYVNSDSIRSAQGYLKDVDRLPADGYTNMASLEHEYRNPDAGEEATRKHDIPALIHSLQNDFDKLKSSANEKSIDAVPVVSGFGKGSEKDESCPIPELAKAPEAIKNPFPVVGRYEASEAQKAQPWVKPMDQIDRSDKPLVIKHDGGPYQAIKDAFPHMKNEDASAAALKIMTERDYKSTKDGVYKEGERLNAASEYQDKAATYIDSALAHGEKVTVVIPSEYSKAGGEVYINTALKEHPLAPAVQLQIGHPEGPDVNLKIDKNGRRVIYIY
jgi:hypothetical protein